MCAALPSPPERVRGGGSFDTPAIAPGGGACAVKAGAEGVATAMVPGLGLGIALKIDDGARRAADTAMAALLKFIGVLDGEAQKSRADFLAAPVRSVDGRRVGELRPTAGWPG